MKFSYKFTNLLGTVYTDGNLLFTPDGYSLISPVGNRLTIYDLKNNAARTLSLESRYYYTSIALSPDGTLLLAINASGDAHLITMITCTVIQRHKFQDQVRCVQFSPDGAHFAVAKGNIVFVFKAPGKFTGEYKPFVLVKHFLAGCDDVTCLDWSSDARFLAIGCRDNTTKIIALSYMDNFRTYNLCGHTDAIVASFFELNSLHMNTLSANGQLCLWECSLSLSDITEATKDKSNRPQSGKRIKKTDAKKAEESEEEENNDEALEPQTTGQLALPVDLSEVMKESSNVASSHPFFYKKLARHYLADEPRKENRDAMLTAAHYHRAQKILIVSFSTGAFYLYELPDLNMIHSLSISSYPISTAIFNSTGDWVALASRELGQLLVWEWRSEQYIIKQQGHNSDMSCVSYSPDGQYLATGGEDAKVKLWNVHTGFCFVTFSEHTSGVTAVKFSNKKFLVSASLDGTVRAYDINRYRNFRTFTSPRMVQYACVDIDHSGELVAAGGQDVFEIYLWSMKLGKLLEVISGHEGPVSTLAFAPIITSSTLVSGSWDKTIKIWNCLESSSAHETIDMLHDVTSLAYDPSGKHISVATLNGNITTYDVSSAEQVGSIEGRHDLNYGTFEKDIKAADTNLSGRYFATIDYSVDGECILAAGKSPLICIYHARESVLLKKLLISQNYSLSDFYQFMGHRKATEFGNMALVEMRSAQHDNRKMNMRLPGTTKHDASLRNFKPEVRVFAVKYSVTSQCFVAASTEGLCVYSLDNSVVFDPLYLTYDVTPKAVKVALKKEEYLKALIMTLKLNDNTLMALVMERIPYNDIQLIGGALSSEFAQRLLQRIMTVLKTTAHIEFYLQWICCLLSSHGNKDNIFASHSLLALHEAILYKYESLHKICDFNKYTMDVLISAAAERRGIAAGNNVAAQSDAEMSSDEELLMPID